MTIAHSPRAQRRRRHRREKIKPAPRLVHEAGFCRCANPAHRGRLPQRGRRVILPRRRPLSTGKHERGLGSGETEAPRANNRSLGKDLRVRAAPAIPEKTNKVHSFKKGGVKGVLVPLILGYTYIANPRRVATIANRRGTNHPSHSFYRAEHRLGAGE